MIKINFLKSFTLFGFCLLFGSINAQIEDVRRITKTLCSTEFHGRGYVNKGDSIAAEFIVSEFKKIGLKPYKKTFFQKFQFNVNSFPGKMEVIEGTKKLIPGVHFLVDPSSASSQMIWQPKLVSVEVALDKEQLKNEITFIKQSPAYNAIAFNFSKVSKDTLKLLAGLTDQLAEVLPVLEVVNQKFTWSVSQTQFKFPYIQIQDSIFKDGQELDVNIEAKWIQNYTSRNIIAYKKGKRKAKTIVFSAHYDHLGQMGTNTFFPGGNDNASGTAMLLSMAKYYSENPNDYNLVFIAFAGEEIGLVGSHYFVEHPTIPLSKINFLINLDIMGSGEEGITVVNATKFENEFNQLVKINEENQLLTQIKKRGPAANSDHYWFSEKGVPSFFIYTQGPNKHYHDIFDTYEELSFKEYEDIKSLLMKFVQYF